MGTSCTKGHHMITTRKAKKHHLSLVAHSSKDTLRERNNIKEELESPHLLAAMQEEINALHSNKTWILVPKSPGSNPSHVSELVRQLGKKFAMKDLGPLHFFLGVVVKYFNGSIHLSQSKYVSKLLDNTEMTFSKVVATPLAPKHGLHESVGSLVETSFYKMIVGSLQYLILTRPDITHVVNLASQFMQNPNNGHLQGVKRIFRLYGYSDADWGGCTTTRRSTTGYSIYLGANCISWTSKKQSTIARSSAEAEYRALASTASEMTWIMHLLHDLMVFLRSIPTLYCDNMSALYMIVNPVMQARTKHVEMDYHFVREKVVRGQLVTQFVRSKDQLEDIQTKEPNMFLLSFVTS
ncbi:uncharacterized protein LOC107021877 [Solanum pennellii]|uniref:Uncharacterized protein LOC107021877 n=1 Tax=Solanum pennellii TaxID=28526 RepID=A0ABM1GZC5_SOLPN|nr:uncharacterized protein LOC107021877 [Solanum pennellii]